MNPEVSASNRPSVVARGLADRLVSALAVIAFSTIAVFMVAPTADAALVTYHVDGGWATNAGTHNLNGRAPFPGGGSYAGQFTIDDSTYALTDYNLTSQLNGRFTTFDGSYVLGAARTSSTGTSNSAFFQWFDAPSAGRRFRLWFVLESGSAWGDDTVNFSQVFTDVDTYNWVGTGIIQASGTGMAVTSVPLPAALPLMFSALAGLGLSVRRRHI